MKLTLILEKGETRLEREMLLTPYTTDEVIGIVDEMIDSLQVLEANKPL